MKHRTDIERYAGNLEELAEDMGNLRYDALAVFLRLLAAKLGRDASADEERGRRKLAALLEACAGQVTTAALDIQRAWQICEPHMADD